MERCVEGEEEVDEREEKAKSNGEIEGRGKEREKIEKGEGKTE